MFSQFSDLDLRRCAQALQHHEECRPDTCFKIKNGKKDVNCRYGYPKTEQAVGETFVKYEKSAPDSGNKLYITMEANRPPGNERINAYCRMLLQLVRANQDMKVICDPKLCFYYLLKYVTK